MCHRIVTRGREKINIQFSLSLSLTIIVESSGPRYGTCSPLNRLRPLSITTFFSTYIFDRRMKDEIEAHSNDEMMISANRQNAAVQRLCQWRDAVCQCASLIGMLSDRQMADAVTASLLLIHWQRQRIIAREPNYLFKRINKTWAMINWLKCRLFLRFV